MPSSVSRLLFNSLFVSLPIQGDEEGGSSESSEFSEDSVLFFVLHIELRDSRDKTYFRQQKLTEKKAVFVANINIIM